MNFALTRQQNIMIVSLLALIILLFFRIYQIYSYPIPDFDTSSILLGISGDFYRDFKSFTDTAHPGLLSIFVFLGNLATRTTGIYPTMYWSIVLSLSLITSVFFIFIILKSFNTPMKVAIISCIFFILSPAIADTAARSEENIITQTFFLLSLHALLRFFNRSSIYNLFFVSFSAILLAAQHLQPFIVICGGLILHLIFGAIVNFKGSTSDIAPTPSKKPFILTLQLPCSFIVPGLLYYIFFSLIPIIILLITQVSITQ